MDILRAIADPNVFGPYFRGTSWDAWKAFLAALFALPMTDEQVALYQQHTGRTDPPKSASNEAVLICGRRAGKSFTTRFARGQFRRTYPHNLKASSCLQHPRKLGLHLGYIVVALSTNWCELLQRRFTPKHW